MEKMPELWRRWISKIIRHGMTVCCRMFGLQKESLEVRTSTRQVGKWNGVVGMLADQGGKPTLGVLVKGGVSQERDGKWCMGLGRCKIMVGKGVCAGGKSSNCFVGPRGGFGKVA